MIVLNTCTVRDNAERRAYGRMQHMRALKVADPGRETGRLRLSGRAGSRPHADDRAARRRRVRHERPAAASATSSNVGGTSSTTRIRRTNGCSSRRWAATPTASRTPSRTCVRSSPSSVAVRTTARSASCRTSAAASITGPPATSSPRCGRAIARGAREITLVGQTVNAYADPADGSGFRGAARSGSPRSKDSSGSPS